MKSKKRERRWSLEATTAIVVRSTLTARRNLADRVRRTLEAYRPTPIVDGVTWIEQHLRFEIEGGGTAPFRFEDVPALEEPFRVATSPGFRRGCLVKPIQAAATTAFAIGLPLWKLCTDPANVIITQPTVDDATKFSKTKLDPILEASPSIAERFARPNRADKKSTILIKRAIGGILFMIGTNSPRMMRMLSAPVIVNDEVSAYQRSAGNEGSVIAKSWGRATAFEDPIQWMQSTPLLKGDCLIMEQYEQSDQRIFEVRCVACDEWFAPVWPMVKWQKVVRLDDGTTEQRTDVADGEEVVEHLNDTAHLECPLCTHQIFEGERKEMVRHRRRYRIQRPEVKDFPGWKFNFFASLMPGMRLAKLVSDYRKALNDPETMQQFVNEIEAEVYAGAGSSLDLDAIRDRREVWAAEVPMAVGYLTSFTDVQQDRLEFCVVGWGAGQESWVLGVVRIPGDPAEPTDACWRTLAELQRRPYVHESGAHLYIQRSGIDRGYSADSVEAFVKQHQRNGVVQTAGRNRFDKPILIRQSRKKRDGRARTVPLYHIGVDTAKDRLFSRLKRAAGPGAIHHPVHLPDDALEQYKAEVRVLKRIRQGINAGRSQATYRQVEDRNEMIDLMVGNMAMLALAGDAVRANLHALALRVQAEGAARAGAPLPPPGPSPFTTPLVPPAAEPERTTLPVPRARRVLSKGLRR
jgi:phage terminase large subunit GpA-like protein